MISSIRIDGSTACMTVQGPTDTPVFETFVESTLVPTLRPGGVEVMDNLPPHKAPQVIQRIERVGAHVLFLPAYFPDLNSIEKNVEQGQRVPTGSQSSNGRGSVGGHCLRLGLRHARRGPPLVCLMRLT